MWSSEIAIIRDCNTPVSNLRLMLSSFSLSMMTVTSWLTWSNFAHAISWVVALMYCSGLMLLKQNRILWEELMNMTACSETRTIIFTNYSLFSTSSSSFPLYMLLTFGICFSQIFLTINIVLCIVCTNIPTFSIEPNCTDSSRRGGMMLAMTFCLRHVLQWYAILFSWLLTVLISLSRNYFTSTFCFSTRIWVLDFSPSEASWDSSWAVRSLIVFWSYWTFSLYFWFSSSKSSNSSSSSIFYCSIWLISASLTAISSVSSWLYCSRFSE